MKNLIKILIVLLFSSSAALANQPKLSTEIPPIIRNNFEQRFLIGSATLRFVGIKVYDISLWSQAPKFSYDQAFAIQITYNMNFSSEELAERSITEIERRHQLSAEEQEIYFKNLKTIFHSVKKGDEKIAIFIPKKGVKMFYNNELTGQISDPKFSRLFVDIWLDEKGSYPKVTRKILGGE
jgi:hypothetical protein